MWNAGFKRGKVTNGVVCSNHEILLQEAESHFHEITEIAAEQFHFWQGADQLILFHKIPFEPGCEDRRGDPGHVKQYPCETEEVIPGTSSQLFRLEILDGQVHVQEGAQGRDKHIHTHLRSIEQHDRNIAKQFLDQFKEITERNDVDIIGGYFNQHLGQPRTRKGKAEFDRRSMGRDAADSSARPVVGS